MSGFAPRVAAPPRLPTTFISIQNILNEQVKPGNLATTMGRVTDCRAPIATSGGGCSPPAVRVITDVETDFCQTTSAH